MFKTLEGNGFLFRDECLVTAVCYRLYATDSRWGKAVVEGEIRARGHGQLGGCEDLYMLHTEAGFSLAVELLPGSEPTGWQPFRRVARQEAVRGVG